LIFFAGRILFPVMEPVPGREPASIKELAKGKTHE
jgi:hypothetical protein